MPGTGTPDGPEIRLTVVADNETCVTSNLCVNRLPEVFGQDEDGCVVVLDPHPSAELARELLRARRSCPTRSIRVEGLAED
ncbi:ferredoxin [Streptomyces sp. Ac-502]|uniref:ferredoxin n=1 Tax=Streptomyces sp. Ac-502 TaxID=3342801 RepID=UPI00220CF820|nr:ferredoxin [Streptomyces tumemacerans]